MSVVKCPSCGRSNRVPELGSGQKAVCGSCKSPLPTATAGGNGKPVEVTDATFDSVIGPGKPALIDFWANWCGPCRIVSPIIEQLASEWPDIVFGKVDVDRNSRVPAAYRVSGIPCMVLFKDGREVTRIVGAVPKRDLVQAIQQYLT